MLTPALRPEPTHGPSRAWSLGRRWLQQHVQICDPNRASQDEEGSMREGAGGRDSRSPDASIAFEIRFVTPTRIKSSRGRGGVVAPSLSGTECRL